MSVFRDFLQFLGVNYLTMFFVLMEMSVTSILENFDDILFIPNFRKN